MRVRVSISEAVCSYLATRTGCIPVYERHDDKVAIVDLINLGEPEVLPWWHEAFLDYKGPGPGAVAPLVDFPTAPGERIIKTVPAQPGQVPRHPPPSTRIVEDAPPAAQVKYLKALAALETAEREYNDSLGEEEDEVGPVEDDSDVVEEDAALVASAKPTRTPAPAPDKPWRTPVPKPGTGAMRQME